MTAAAVIADVSLVGATFAVLCALAVGVIVTAVYVDHRLKRAAEYAAAEREDRDNQRRDLVCPANKAAFDALGVTR